MNEEESGKAFFSTSGIPINRLYTSKDLGRFSEHADLGLPGQPPFTRGVYPDMYRGKLWTIRRFSGAGTPEDTNKLYRREYELGQTGFSVAYDAPTAAGIDSDDPRAAGDVGTTGVAVDSLLDVEIMFEGLPIDKVGTALISQTMGSLPLTAMYFAMAEKRGIDLRELDGTTQNDITTGLGAVWHIDQIAPSKVLPLMIDLIEWCSEVAPKWHPVSFDSYNYREQGIDAIQELGQLLATAISYVEEERSRPNHMDLNRFMRRFTFDMGVHNDFFEEIAKFRAARRMWYKIARERFGCEDPRCWQFRFHAQSDGCTHTAREPYNNLIRIAYQTLASVLGGAQSVHANGYDEGICLPTNESMKLSIRTEQILQHETNVINTVDPLGGSYYVESLTNEVERRTWEYIEKIEAMGGIVPALESGWIHGEYIEASNAYEKKVRDGDVTVVGVNRFVENDDEERKYPVFKPNLEATSHQIEKIRRLKRERDDARVQAALARVREATLGPGNVMPAVVEAVRAYATLGEICGVWRGLYGSWAYPLNKV
jgi:methylmalonyl-CoA mutase N-terminal domain/subunit